MNSARFLSTTFAAVAMLSACGGGGSDSPAPAPAAALAITTDNQAVVARAAMDGSMALGGAQVLDNDGRATALSANATARTTARGAVLGAAQQALAFAFPQQRRTALSAKARPLAAETIGCTLGGSFILTTEDRDGNGGSSSGDTLTMSFTQCSELADEQLNGTIVFTLSSFGSETQFGGTLAFQSVTVTAGDTATGINGSVSVEYEETSQTRIEMTVGSGGLTASIDSPDYEDAVVYEAGLRIDMTETATATLFSLDGSLSTTALGGRITVATLQPLAQLNSDAYANSGQVRVDGASSSRLLVTVLSNAQVQLELDANGDGVFTAPTVVPWSDLLSD